MSVRKIGQDPVETWYVTCMCCKAILEHSRSDVKAEKRYGYACDTHSLKSYMGLWCYITCVQCKRPIEVPESRLPGR